MWRIRGLMDTEALRRVLMDAPGEALCEGCLSAIARVSTEETRAGTTALLAETDDFARGWACASCRRPVGAVFYRAKCAYCSGRLQEADKGFRMGEGLFHVVCLRRLITDDSIRLSRELGRRSRRLIEQSRRRMRDGEGWPPLESP